jgi:hypothetical protein
MNIYMQGGDSVIIEKGNARISLNGVEVDDLELWLATHEMERTIVVCEGS